MSLVTPVPRNNATGVHGGVQQTRDIISPSDVSKELNALRQQMNWVLQHANETGQTIAQSFDREDSYGLIDNAYGKIPSRRESRIIRGPGFYNYQPMDPSRQWGGMIDQYDSLAAKLHQQESVTETLKRNLSLAEKENLLLSNEVEKLMIGRNSFRSTISSKDGLIDRLTDEVMQLRTELKTASDKCKVLEEDNLRINQQNERARRQEHALVETEQQSAMCVEAAEEKARLATTQLELTQLLLKSSNATIDERMKEIGQHNKRIVDLTNEIEKQGKAAHEKDVEIKALEHENSDLLTSNRALTNSLRNSEERLDDLEREFKNADQHRDLDSKKSSYRDTVLTRRLTEAQDEINSLKAQVRTLTYENDTDRLVNAKSNSVKQFPLHTHTQTHYTQPTYSHRYSSAVPPRIHTQQQQSHRSPATSIDTIPTISYKENATVPVAPRLDEYTDPHDGRSNRAPMPAYLDTYRRTAKPTRYTNPDTYDTTQELRYTNRFSSSVPASTYTDEYKNVSSEKYKPSRIPSRSTRISTSADLVHLRVKDKPVQEHGRDAQVRATNHVIPTLADDDNYTSPNHSAAASPVPTVKYGRRDWELDHHSNRSSNFHGNASVLDKTLDPSFRSDDSRTSRPGKFNSEHVPSFLVHDVEEDVGRTETDRNAWRGIDESVLEDGHLNTSSARVSQMANIIDTHIAELRDKFGR
eukprot:CFRG6600T1